MKRILFILFGIKTFILFLFSSSIFASGFGFFGSWSKGYIDQKWTTPFSSLTIETNHTKWTGGIVFDTAVAKKKTFNYRLNLGFGQSTKVFDFPGNKETLEMWDYSFFNSFGFGIVKSKYLRLWFGPQIGATYNMGDLKNVEYKEIGFWGGLVAGMNLNFGNTFTVSVDGGFRYGGFVLIALDTDFYADMFTHGYEGFVNCSVIFRINDNYNYMH